VLAIQGIGCHQPIKHTIQGYIMVAGDQHLGSRRQSVEVLACGEKLFWLGPLRKIAARHDDSGAEPVRRVDESLPDGGDIQRPKVQVRNVK
jgi:hypothetical protein